MATDAEKLAHLCETVGIDPAILGAEKKAEADELGLESKEIKPVEDAPEPEAQVAPVAPAITAEDIGTAIATALGPVMAELMAQKERLDKLTVPAEEKEVEPETPLESIMLAFTSGVIGQAEARVDGRTKEAKDGPVETKSPGVSPRDKLHGHGPVVDSINNIFNNNLVKGINEMQGVRQ